MVMTTTILMMINCFGEIADRRQCINPFVPNAPFLYPLKTSENRKVF